MTSYIASDLRRLVALRAHHWCEYCLIAEEDTFLGCQVDHVIAEKHGGETTEENLSFACTFCNRSKGSDIGSIAPSSGEFTRFYNPRVDSWHDHFELKDAIISPRTPVGETTVRILKFNTPERIMERDALIATHRYPPASPVDDVTDR